MLGVFSQVMKEVMEKLAKEDKLAIGEVYEAGELLGLDEEDITILVHRSSNPNAKSLLWRYWYAFLPVTVLIFLFLSYLLWNYLGTPPSGTYPAGTRYGVISTKDFRKKHLP